MFQLFRLFGPNVKRSFSIKRPFKTIPWDQPQSASQTKFLFSTKSYLNTSELRSYEIRDVSYFIPLQVYLGFLEKLPHFSSSQVYVSVQVVLRCSCSIKRNQTVYFI
uniref:Uncharacterized protein n=1 Tax=Cacopsylla melanoneura TaxID=428564 RepID=A0A8D8YW43_9HEMI